MGNYTTIIVKYNDQETEVSGGRTLNATVNSHEDFILGFAEENGVYETIASDDYTDEPLESEFYINTIVETTAIINGEEKTFPIAFKWENFNADILEGMLYRSRTLFKGSFSILEIPTTNTKFIVGNSVHKPEPFKGGKVISVNPLINKSLVFQKGNYSIVEGLFTVGEIINPDTI